MVTSGSINLDAIQELPPPETPAMRRSPNQRKGRYRGTSHIGRYFLARRLALGAHESCEALGACSCSNIGAPESTCQMCPALSAALAVPMSRLDWVPIGRSRLRRDCAEVEAHERGLEDAFGSWLTALSPRSNLEAGIAQDWVLHQRRRFDSDECARREGRRTITVKTREGDGILPVFRCGRRSDLALLRVPVHVAVHLRLQRRRPQSR